MKIYNQLIVLLLWFIQKHKTFDHSLDIGILIQVSTLDLFFIHVHDFGIVMRDKIHRCFSYFNKNFYPMMRPQSGHVQPVFFFCWLPNCKNLWRPCSSWKNLWIVRSRIFMRPLAPSDCWVWMEKKCFGKVC